MCEWLGAAPRFCEPRRSSAARARSLPPAVSKGEEDPRNRQKELQELIVSAENVECILATVRELEGAIVISTALHRLGKVPVTPQVFKDPRFHLLLDRFRSRLPFFGSRRLGKIRQVSSQRSSCWLVHDVTDVACKCSVIDSRLKIPLLTTDIKDVKRFAGKSPTRCTGSV